MSNPESTGSSISPYDHAPRFIAFEQHQEELSGRLEALLDSTDPQPVEVHDPESRLLLSAEEIGKLWGLFSANARARVVTNPPIIKSDTPRWFARGSSSGSPVITDKVGEAISPTAHGLAVTENRLNEDGSVAALNITVHEIPENGFTDKVRRLVQAGAVMHELAHTIEKSDLWGKASGHQLMFPAAGYPIPAWRWFATFAEIAEQYPPISRYSSAYRNDDNTFPREGGSLVVGAAVEEELVESITAELLGFTLTQQGLTFEPFKDRKEIQKGIQAYLNSRFAKTNP